MEYRISLANSKEKTLTYENKLIKKAMRGNGEALIKLIEVYKVYLYKIAYAYVKSEDIALDVIQECSYKAMINIKNLKNPKLFKTWITRILINTAINIMRKQGRIDYINEEIPLVDDSKALAIEEKLDLYNAIELLNYKYKMAIILKYFNDLSIEEIANVMEIPNNTVKSYLKRGREALSNILKEGYLDE